MSNFERAILDRPNLSFAFHVVTETEINLLCGQQRNWCGSAQPPPAPARLVAPETR